MGSVALHLDFVAMVSAIVNLLIVTSDLANVGKHVSFRPDTRNDRFYVFHDCIIEHRLLFMLNT
jgi:hypothetical protein